MKYDRITDKTISENGITKNAMPIPHKRISNFWDNLKIKTHHYSYPEGMHNSFNNRVIKVLKNNGIKICPTAIEGYNTSVSDLFNLRRVIVL